MQTQLSTPVVLLVEDHEDSREMYVAGLQHAGFAVQAAESPSAAAAALARTARVDVVVLDYAMPRMTGADLAVRLKEHPATAHAAFVLITGQGPEALRTAASRVHFDAMVKKPVASDQLARVLMRVLRR